tara:strand:+ start:694 stop:1095 length:402 start_codon:yes stop_codon:yes gene_type:complete
MDNTFLKIRHFKLVNGEEIVAFVKDKDDGTFTVERPYVVKNNLIGGFAFLPWFPFSSQKLFKIKYESILHHVEIDEDIKQEYIKLATGALKPRPKPPLISDEQMMAELEDYINETYDELEPVLPEDPKKETIH